MKRKIIIALAVLLFIVIGVCGYFFVVKPHAEAVKNYEKVVSVINKENKKVDDKIADINKLIDSNEKVIDLSIIETAKETTKEAGLAKKIVGKIPRKTKDINERAKELSAPYDLSEQIEKLDNVYEEYTTSIKQYKQLTNPSEEFVKQRLLRVDEIKDVRAVTEDNDPNGQLNKPHGYTATLYFESKNVNQKKVYGKNLIDKGTDAGGAIEVYADEEDAKKREEYLAGFDGSILASGSHRVIGTVLIRTSNELPASKQKALEEKIIKVLIELE